MNLKISNYFFFLAFFTFSIIGCSEGGKPESIAEATLQNDDLAASLVSNFQPIAKELIINGSSERWTLQIKEGSSSFYRSFEKNIAWNNTEFVSDGQVKLSNDDGEVIVNIIEEDCARAERSKTTPLSANFTLGDQLLEGCGAWKVDSKILGRWKLSYLEGHEMIDSLFKRGYPEFILKGRNIMGQAGCNQFRASFSSKQNELYVGQVMMTKMSCSLIRVEQDLMAALTVGPALFKTDGQTLEFIDDSGKVIMRFVKNEE